MPAWVPLAIGAGAALDSYTSKKANDRAADLSEAELEFLQGQYADRAPIRALGLKQLGMDLPQRPDLTADFADPSNPFYRRPSALPFGQFAQYNGQRPSGGSIATDRGAPDMRGDSGSAGIPIDQRTNSDNYGPPSKPLLGDGLPPENRGLPGAIPMQGYDMMSRKPIPSDVLKYTEGYRR